MVRHTNDNQRAYKVFCYHVVMTKRTVSSNCLRESLLVLSLGFFVLPLSAAPTKDPGKLANSAMVNDKPSPEQKWEPSEQNQLKVKLLSYQFLKAKNDGDFNSAFELFSASTKSNIDFKQWKYNLLIFNATAGANVDRTFTRISWYENSPMESLSGVFATVDYSSVYTNVDIACGNLIWHKKDDGNFELIHEQENFIDKSSQEKLSEIEITETKTKLGCKDPISPE